MAARQAIIFLVLQNIRSEFFGICSTATDLKSLPFPSQGSQESGTYSRPVEAQYRPFSNSGTLPE